ncbi:DNA cytosine methyltransferase [Noviherbaspirillum saxi]|uniref:DNA cytosine methyltransferase n=1 Tax=Noviherbaspirillum saxi TaxID=2320863 RepID=A0A3A3FTE3_9BURK|nr:DNA cytosine methyltransferase [Noviherbaspirillum saxi]RJF99063.1 DNA cytosine methyltransferase [Noviherbaspirillum saxi]
MISKEIRHFHFCCGIGGAAKGFNKANPRVGVMQGKFRCIGGVDVDASAIRDFNRLAGVPGTVMDLFTRGQYVAFHGKEPPQDWREMGPADIRRAAGNERPHIVFISSPCKGASGLLSEKMSQTAKYQALNELTLRCIWLMSEAWADDPIDLIVFENVPRLATRGRHLLDQINQLLQRYGYAVAETTHDCGELGGLAQSRKRFLLVARHIEKVPPFLYEPEKKRLRAVGDVLGRMPFPGAPAGGPMHRIPRLQWKTWVRLAFVEPGSDWRSLNKLAVENGHLSDFLIVPEYRPDYLGVNQWEKPVGAVSGRAGPSNGAYSVADPRFDSTRGDYGQYGLCGWNETMGAVINVKSPGQGTFAVQDPRAGGERHANVYRIVRWNQASGTVTADFKPTSGGGVADPRIDGVRHNNVFNVVDFCEPAGAITAGGHPTSGGQAVTDPRTGKSSHSGFGVTDWDDSASTVAGESLPSNGNFAVADPRPGWERHGGNLSVMDWERPANVVIAGGKGVQGGWMSVADPRTGMNRGKGDNYLTGGHYGVVPWVSPSGAVSAAAGHDNGRWSVADPRIDVLPALDQKTVAIIRAIDGTWHRPFTTLELAALQSLIEPEEHLILDGMSDSVWREHIGNLVPPDAAEAIAGVMGTTLLLAWSGETFVLSRMPVWVRDVAVAISLSQEQ